MPFLFEKLHVYQRSVDIAERLCTLAAGFPHGHRFLADQLSRASISIATNIAEGNGRYSRGERAHFFGIARGSAHECVPLLELALRRGLVSEADMIAHHQELDEVCKMLNGLIRGIPERGKR